MSKIRLFFLLLLLSFLLSNKMTAQSSDRPENQRCADLGNGYYQNPILGGDYPDPSILRVGDDYYMTHSSFIYYPGLLVLHSKDLVNWEPVVYALNKYVGSVYAPDLIKYKNTYYIYFPANGTNWVVSAPSPEGPWSDPVDLNIDGIDPGHIVANGKRYLHLSGGGIVQLADDGLSTVGPVRKTYDGWEIPDSLNIECFCLEGPKLTHKGNYYYLTVAEGGTAGPSTSHLVVSARSRSVDGPWTNSPYNPIIHTNSISDKWWSQGHGSLVDDTEGHWWILYHGYENNYRTLGRQTLMLPVKWTEDGWYKIPDGVKADQPIKKPTGENIGNGMKLSDDFSSDKLGLQWQFFKGKNLDRIQLKNNSLYFEAQSESLSESSPLLCIPVNHSYQLTTELEISDGATAGLTVFYSEDANVGVGMDINNIYVYRHGDRLRMGRNTMGKHGFLKLVNHQNEIFMYTSPNGKSWHRVDKSLEVSGFNHNSFGGFLSLRAGLFAFGDGQVKFSNFTYQGLE